MTYLTRFHPILIFIGILIREVSLVLDSFTSVCAFAVSLQACNVVRANCKICAFILSSSSFSCLTLINPFFVVFLG
jgi:hypothetical protein